ncbi:ABC transporter ATP-binding protein [Actinomyces sp.]|uniref:ABC transporter ATP-binding protein n=1 Tax=Actinomyces sp. TaxID=29317 RepID=UPI0028A019F3|nr:ABC transporter ATP-binding protein [Actinomyces sp.]
MRTTDDLPELLRVEGLRTDIDVRQGVVHPLDGIDLTVRAGETLGLVGESGCGKTMTALSIMGLLPAGGHVVGGRILLEGQDLVQESPREVRRLRGTRAGMIFQDPLTSLNPTMTIGRQVSEPLRVHEHLKRCEVRERCLDTLRRVGMPRPEAVFDAYPHQLSGGMRQRVMIAMALVCHPRLLIADEPTTALDVTTQRQILELIDDLRDEYEMGVVLITHDLGVVAGHTDRVAVMYAGRVVEEAGTAELFEHPRHRYTNSLLAALPERALQEGRRLFSIPGIPPTLRDTPVGCRFADRCLWALPECREEDPRLLGDGGHVVACLNPAGGGHPVGAVDGVATWGDAVGAEERPDLPDTEQVAVEELQDGAPVLEVEAVTKEYDATSGGLFHRHRAVVSAVDRVTLRILPGTTYGLVGESGCGKSTIGRLIAGLEAPSSGAVRVLGKDITTSRGHERKRIHRDVQMMFQDSYAAMDPRMRIDEILAEPMRIQGMGGRAVINQRIDEILEQVGLPADTLDRYPHEFSGGQLQRVGLARSLTLAPDVIVADEPVSALDVSIQAQVLNLMRDLQRRLGIAYVFISHDLAVVQYMADTIGVMYLGRLVEEGPAAEVVHNPRHPYTRALIDAIPVPDPTRNSERDAVRLQGEPPSAIDPPEGCRFRTRCPLATEACLVEPPLEGEGHAVACHFPLGEPEAASA